MTAAAHYGLKIEDIMTAVGLTSELLEDVEARLSHETYCNLWRTIAYQSDDPTVGLQMAEFIRPATLDVLGYMICYSANLAEAIDRIVQYSRLMHAGIVVLFKVQDNVARLTMTFGDEYIAIHRAYHQWALAGLILICRRSTGVDIMPLNVGFQHSEPDDLSAYQSLFRSPLEFDQPYNTIAFDTALLDLPLLNADSTLSAIFDQCAEKALAALPSSDRLEDRVRQALVANLRSGNPTIEAVAARVKYAPRTLQRKLKEEGTSYRDLLDEVRRELSIHYLREERIAIGEIAFLLGFSGTSAFYRAFKRWTGISPGEFWATPAIEIANVG
ncbi:MAG: AraC family transcriptional regulator [Stenomitos rutilans HA7619-LM2]|nr:AraC family transcriptional regulator [Stenomitos rutilans HA7619-LM2]